MKLLLQFLNPWLTRSSVAPLHLLPHEMQMLAQTIGAQSTQEAALRYVYDVLAKKYRGYRMLTFLRLDRLFLSDIETLWNIQGFLQCHHMNYLLRTLLVASGQFQPEDIEARWTYIWFVSPHQYLVATLSDGQRIEVDLWGRVYGIPFGSHAHGFQSGSLQALSMK